MEGRTNEDLEGVLEAVTARGDTRVVCPILWGQCATGVGPVHNDSAAHGAGDSPGSEEVYVSDVQCGSTYEVCEGRHEHCLRIRSLLLLCFLVHVLVVGCYVPVGECSSSSLIDRARPWLPLLESVLFSTWPQCPMPEIVPTQIGQESSWKQRAELKTYREYGFGFGQITVTDRFNNFLEAKRVTGMKDLPWDQRFDAKFQFKYLVLSDKSNYQIATKFLDGSISRTKGMLICYNAGPGTLLHRKREALKRGLKPPRQWDQGLADIHAPYEERLLYGQPLWKMRNNYPVLIFKKSKMFKGVFHVQIPVW